MTGAITFTPDMGKYLNPLEPRVNMPNGGFPCPTCGKDTFDIESAMMKHHTQAHGESLSLVTLECDGCGETFERQRSEVSEFDNNFCSADCQGKYISEQGIFHGENNPRYSGGPLDIECDYCGGIFKRDEADTKNREHQFCSLECMGAFQSELPPERTRNWQGGPVTVECAICGTELIRKRSELDRSEDFLCSKECYSKWVTGRFAGENHVFWKGGTGIDYGPGWNERKRESVRERDNRKCVDCGMDESKHVKRYNRKLNVHHLISARDSTNPAVHNAARNLTTLCQSCHTKRENSMMIQKNQVKVDK